MCDLNVILQSELNWKYVLYFEREIVRGSVDTRSFCYFFFTDVDMHTKKHDTYVLVRVSSLIYF